MRVEIAKKMDDSQPGPSGYQPPPSSKKSRRKPRKKDESFHEKRRLKQQQKRDKIADMKKTKGKMAAKTFKYCSDKNLERLERRFEENQAELKALLEDCKQKLIAEPNGDWDREFVEKQRSLVEREVELRHTIEWTKELGKRKEQVDVEIGNKFRPMTYSTLLTEKEQSRKLEFHFAIAREPENDVAKLSKTFDGITIKNFDLLKILRLRSEENSWLTTVVLDHYLRLVMTINNDIFAYTVDHFKTIMKGGHTAVYLETNKEAKGRRIKMFPCFVKDHWLLVVARHHPGFMDFYCYDSYPLFEEFPIDVIQSIKLYIVQEELYGPAMKGPVIFRDKKAQQLLQLDEDSCGAYVLWYARLFSLNVNVFLPITPRELRDRLFLEIMDGRVLDVKTVFAPEQKKERPVKKDRMNTNP